MAPFALASLSLCLLFGAETPKVEPPKPRTAPLPELASVKLQNNALRAELLKQQFTQLQAENQALVAETCAVAGFKECDIDAQGKLLTERLAAKVAAK